jgi:hypothetical protein
MRAVVKLEFDLTTPTGAMIDLTPPHTVDDTGTDPDPTAFDSSTIISVSTGAWQVSESAWTVAIFGGDADFFLEEGERASVTVWIHRHDLGNDLYELGSGESDPWIDAPGQLLAATDRLTVRISVRNGTGLEFDRILPIELTARILLD